MFKEKKQGDYIHLLEIDIKTGEAKYHKATITEINDPKFETNTFGAVDYTKPARIEISVELSDGSKQTFARINPENNFSIGGKYRISTSKEMLRSELDKIIEEKQDHINRVEEYKQIVESCNEALQEMGVVNIPSETDKRLNKLESNIYDLTSMVQRLIDNRR